MKELKFPLAVVSDKAGGWFFLLLYKWNVISPFPHTCVYLYRVIYYRFLSRKKGYGGNLNNCRLMKCSEPEQTWAPLIALVQIYLSDLGIKNIPFNHGTTWFAHALFYLMTAWVNTALSYLLWSTKMLYFCVLILSADSASVLGVLHNRKRLHITIKPQEYFQ